ncbi:MAG: hypothetical protein Hyperionvirus17_37 [Hyperionvirus sp.]|uniref:Uncharacterized protein n=1 Tax=Hyperionvirus sp. TaxID=2487770 RepID=A0A3G5AA38_9VIRU|nr:MAG: hypothetical protein Hyperionvirus17_37 [Hyperionvirus sp.]
MPPKSRKVKQDPTKAEESEVSVEGKPEVVVAAAPEEKIEKKEWRKTNIDLTYDEVESDDDDSADGSSPALESAGFKATAEAAKPSVGHILESEKYRKLNEEKFKDFSNNDLLNVLMVRGLDNQNPTLFGSCRKLFSKLNFEKLDKYSEGGERFSRNNSSQGPSFGRGGYRGGSSRGGGGDYGYSRGGGRGFFSGNGNGNGGYGGRGGGNGNNNRFDRDNSGGGRFDRDNSNGPSRFDRDNGGGPSRFSTPDQTQDTDRTNENDTSNPTPGFRNRISTNTRGRPLMTKQFS